jgi:hypothetical protein
MKSLAETFSSERAKREGQVDPTEETLQLNWPDAHRMPTLVGNSAYVVEAKRARQMRPGASGGVGAAR